MFSKKTALIVGVLFLIACNIVFLSIMGSRYATHGPGRIAIYLVTRLQDAVTSTIRFSGDLWRHYFYLASAAQENEALRKDLEQAMERSNRIQEVTLSNARLRDLLSFRETLARPAIAAEVIGKDPSTWFKTIIIDKGRADGVGKGFPVVVPQGVVGQVIEASDHHSKVLLVIDQNSAVDALVQRTRARGIIKGGIDGRCRFQYALRQDEIGEGDAVVSSGLDGVFPKGLRIGEVVAVSRMKTGIFQEVEVAPDADFEKIEEVLVLLAPRED